jgi:hypothetical protein
MHLEEEECMQGFDGKARRKETARKAMSIISGTDATIWSKN